MKKLLVCSMTFAALIVVASADTLTFGTSDVPVSGTQQIASGTVATGVEAHIAEGETLVLTNGDITLNAPAAGEKPSIAVDGGKLRVASALAAPDGLLVAGDSEMLVQTEFYPNAYNHSTTSSLFAAGKNIDDYVPAAGKCILRLSDMSNPKSACPYYVRRSPGELTFELQFSDGYLRSIKVRLYQMGEDIYAQVMWARWADTGFGCGYSLENNVGTAVPIYSQTHKNTDSQMWYGVHTLVLMPNSSANATCLSGDISVSDGMTVESGFASIEGAGTIANDLAGPLVLSNSTLRVCRDVDTTLRADIKAFNGVLVFGSGNNSFREESGTIPTIDYNSVTTLFRDALIENLEITGADLLQRNGATIYSFPTKEKWFGWNEKRDGLITFQVQIADSGYNKCAIVEIWQEGSNIVGKTTSSPYNSSLTTSPLGTDMRIRANVTGNGNYFATNITYTMRFNMSPAVHLAGTATNGAPMSVVVESNAVVKVNGFQAVPLGASGSVTIERGGEMLWQNAGGSAAQQVFNVRGKLSYMSLAYIDNYIHYLDGGTLALYNIGEGSTDEIKRQEAGQSLGKMTFRDGARLVGRRPRIRGSSASSRTRWTVTGNAPSFWESGGRLTGSGTASTEGAAAFTVDVADVTGNDDADFISTPATLSGFSDSLFTDFQSNSSYMRLRIVKTGGGTWEWRAKGGTWTGRLVVNAGAVRFMKSETMAADGLGVQLGGGELQLAAGTTNSVPKLVVSANSTLSLSEGAVIEFPDGVESFASGTTISNGVTFAISGPDVTVGRRMGVRFGTSACLSDNVLRQIKYNDMRVMQDSEGWLKPYVAGFMIIVQ